MTVRVVNPISVNTKALNPQHAAVRAGLQTVAAIRGDLERLSANWPTSVRAELELYWKGVDVFWEATDADVAALAARKYPARTP